VIVRNGNPGEPEVLRSPLAHLYIHRIALAPPAAHSLHIDFDSRVAGARALSAGRDDGDGRAQGRLHGGTDVSIVQ